MKKLISTLVLLVFTTSIISCSKDADDSTIVRDATGILSLKINQVQYNFGTLKVFEERYADYSDLIVKGTDLVDPTKTISIALGKNLLGGNSVYFIQYNNNGTFYQDNGTAMTTDITESSSSKIIGTFSGTIATENMDELLISDGIINVSY